MLKRTRLSAVLLAFVLFFSAIPLNLSFAAFEDEAKAAVQFNLRNSRVDSRQNIIINVPRNAKLTVTVYYDDGWCKAVYRGRTGYAKTEWLKFPNGSHEDETVSSSSEDEDIGDPEYAEDAEDDESYEDDADTVTGSEDADSGDEGADVSDDAGNADEGTEEQSEEDARGWKTPSPAAEVLKPTLKSRDARVAEPVPCGVSVGESDTDEVQYVALVRDTCSIRETPEDNGRKIYEVKDAKRVHVLAYGDDWCKVQSSDGKAVGYLKTKFIYHFHSTDPFKYIIPWYDGYRSTGWISMNEPVLITDHKNTYKGQNMQIGDLITVRLRDDGDYDFIIRRDWVTLDASMGEYHPFVQWNEAKEGDVIGGFTMHYGLTQGGAFKTNRKRNIGIATKRMDGNIIEPGEFYSFLDDVGPVSTRQGYRLAGVTGGSGTGIGGGICHTSSVTYSAALSVPFYIYEREPHTSDGTAYTLLEFDATVGVFDMSFYNVLPYAVKEHCFHDKASGTMTILWECLETLDKDTLDNWDWTTLDIKKSPFESTLEALANQ